MDTDSAANKHQQQSTVVVGENSRAIVVVLGDIGHSPRMCYQAISLAKHGVNVEMIGYRQSEPHGELRRYQKRIRLVGVRPPALWLPLPLRFLWLTMVLGWALVFRTAWRCQLVLVQNPPGVPTLAICWLAKWLKGASLVVDWHNYTWSMLEHKSRLSALLDSGGGSGSSQKAAASLNVPGGKRGGKGGGGGNSNSRSPTPSLLAAKDAGSNEQSEQQTENAPTGLLSSLAHWFEGCFGGGANWHLCVSNKMQRDLRERWAIPALTLHDKAPEWVFRPLPLEEQHAFLLRFCNPNDPDFGPVARSIAGKKSFQDHFLVHLSSEERSLFTERKQKGGEVCLRSDRPLLLVSSTSWTPDEDFQMLLDALCLYDKQAVIAKDECDTDHPATPKMLAVITGKGPLKAHFEAKIAALRLQCVHVVTAWLPAEDYPRLLACADLGVSLHSSTSGLDLPMKVVDMLGCHLPVLAKRFPAIDELVVAGTSGQLFDTAQELRHGLLELANGFPNSQKLQKLRDALRSQLGAGWDANWEAVAWPLFQRLFPPPSAEEEGDEERGEGEENNSEKEESEGDLEDEKLLNGDEDASEKEEGESTDDEEED